MRVIREHRVFGKAIVVKALSQDSAAEEVRKRTSKHIWEIKELASGMWEAYVANHEDCFALND